MAASTIPFDDGPAFLPTHTAKSLPADGFVMYAALPSPGSHPTPDEWNRRPGNPRLHLRLAEFEVQREGQVAPNVPEYLLWKNVADQFLEVRIWFGTLSPSAATLHDAQEELHTMYVPLSASHPKTPSGRCRIRPAFGLTIGGSSGPAGSTINVAGVSLPGTNEAGHTVGPGKLSFWWNLDPAKYWSVMAGQTPSPAASGPVVKLGSQGRSSPCGYAVALRVPNVPAGAYLITPVISSGGSSTNLLPLPFQLTPAEV